MTDVENLVANKNHLAITEIEDPNVNEYKCIAFIKLSMYKEALPLCVENSYEMIYVLYKLKKYGKCLRMINKSSENQSSRFKILKSQVLYNLGRYNQAYLSLKDVTLDDEVAINLEAMKSLAISKKQYANKLPGIFSFGAYKDKEVEYKDLSTYKFRKASLAEEFKYNESFRSLSANYQENLESLVAKYPSGYIKRQLDLLRGDFNNIDVSQLTTSEIEALKFNMKETNKLTHPAHFHINFSKKDFPGHLPPNEFLCYKKVQESNYECDNIVPNKTLNLRLLNCIINLNKMLSDKPYSRKYFPTSDSEYFEWNIVRMLSVSNEELKKNMPHVLHLLSYTN